MRDFRSGLGANGAGFKVRFIRRLRVDEAKVSKLVGEWAVARIKERTRRGIGSDGRPFKPYEESTRKRDGSRGRVDLDKDGRLLGALRVLKAAPGLGGLDIRIGVTSDLERLAGYLHNGTRHMDARPWLGLTREDLRDLAAFLEKRNVFREVAGS